MLGNIRKRLILLAGAIALPGAPAHAADWRLTAARHTPFGASLAFLTCSQSAAAMAKCSSPPRPSSAARPET
jgi:hypothetical protein